MSLTHNQAGGDCGWSSCNRLAQLPAHRECLEQGGGSRTRTRKNAFASRGHRDYLERVWGSGDESQAADSATHGRIRQAASIRGNLETGSSLAGKPTRYYSVTLRGPYLTQILFADFPKSKKRLAPQVGLEPTTLRLTVARTAKPTIAANCDCL